MAERALDGKTRLTVTNVVFEYFADGTVETVKE